MLVGNAGDENILSIKNVKNQVGKLLDIYPSGIFSDLPPCIRSLSEIIEGGQKLLVKLIAQPLQLIIVIFNRLFQLLIRREEK